VRVYVDWLDRRLRRPAVRRMSGPRVTLTA
jgi:hypothetical protein